MDIWIKMVLVLNVDNKKLDFRSGFCMDWIKCGNSFIMWIWVINWISTWMRIKNGKLIWMWIKNGLDLKCGFSWV